MRVGALSDLYLSMMSYDPNEKKLGLRAFINPLVSWIWLGTLIMMIGGVLAILPRRSA